MIRIWNRLIPLFAALLTFALSAQGAADQSVALAVGNSDYKSSPLKNPAKDYTLQNILVRKWWCYELSF
ncbi:MAG: hypothetical protein JEZ11_17640 [Desulfobacterales bacterium]|nr:hypothetical protein [Desulfobacterales bacterium]